MVEQQPEVIMAAFPLLVAAGISAVGAGISAYSRYKQAKGNRPFMQDAFKQKAQTGYLRKYMADLRGRSANRARTELAMRPALRAIGQQQRKGQRQLSYQAAQQGLEGSGIEAQKQLALQQGTTQAVTGLGEKVLSSQLASARQMQAQREGQRMKLAGEIGRIESGTATANQLAQFRADESNRQAQQQYQQSVAAAKGSILPSILGGAIQGATPYLTSMAGSVGTTEDIMKNISYTDTGGGSSYYGNAGGKVTKEGIAQYQGGGYAYEDVSTAVPGMAAAEEELRKKRQTEFDLATAEQEKRKRAFETGEVARKKQIEESNILAQQQFEESEKASLEADKERFKTEALKNITDTEEYEKQKALFDIGEGRRDVLGSQKKTTKLLKKEGIKDESGEEIYGTKGLTGENVEGALDYLKTDPEEYNVLKEKADVLEKYNIGEKQYANAKKLFEKNQRLGELYTGKKYDNLDDFITNSKIGKEVWGEGSENKGTNYGTLSKRNKRKLTKKYNKKALALLQSKGKKVDEEKYREALETKDPGEAPGMDFERTAPGEAPEAQEYTAKEFAEEAPTLQAPTEKELYNLRRKEIYKQLQAGVDVKANIATAKKNRETTDFFKTFTAGNMTTDQIWSHPYATSNPAKVATLITQTKKAQAAEDKQYARTQVINEVIQAGNVEDDLSTPGNERDMAMADVLNSEAFINADPTMQMQILNETQQQRNAIARDNAKDVKLADKFSDTKNLLSNLFFATGQVEEGTQGHDIMKILNQPGNEEGITKKHLEDIKKLLSNADMNIGEKAPEGVDPLVWGELQKLKGTDNKSQMLKILNKLNKEEFLRDEDQLAQSGEVSKISSQADYNALPPGTSYIAPDGTRRVKK